MVMRVLAASIVLASVAASSGQILLSVANNLDNELAGVTFRDGDIVETNPAGTVASIFAAESLFGTNPDIDAFHVLPDGSWLVSALFNDLSFGGATSYLDGDIARYDPATGQHELYFSEALLSGTSPDISGVSIAPNGNLLISTLADAMLAGVSFTDGDIVEYDAAAGTAAIVVAEADLFDDGDGDVYGLHALPDGTYLLSANADELISGTLFRDGDIFSYDPATGAAALVFSEDSFGGTIDDTIDALYYIPEPGTLLLAATIGLLARRR